MKLLIVDDEEAILRTMSLALESMGHTVFTARNTKIANVYLQEELIHAVFLDLGLGSESGIDFLEQIRKANQEIPIIVLTGNSTVENAVNSMRKGATDYLQKPFVPQDIQQKLDIIQREIELNTTINLLENQLAKNNPNIILESQEESVNQVFQTGFKAARSNASIMILGPSGTGKTVLAHAIHLKSDRADKPFVTVNCPSLSRELFESELFGHVKGAFTGAINETWGKVAAAEGGTLFLDEIGELPSEIQSKLLRVLQDHCYERVGETKTHKANIRLLAATNLDLREQVKLGKFREDLFYRINVISLKMPPLEERPADIIPFAESFLSFFSKQQNKPKLTFSNDAITALLDYHWPGNLRELRNVIERTTILSTKPQIELEDLPDDLQQRSEKNLRLGCQNMTIAEIEELHAKLILKKSRNMEQAAKSLGIDVATLYRKRKKWQQKENKRQTALLKN